MELLLLPRRRTRRRAAGRDNFERMLGEYQIPAAGPPHQSDLVPELRTELSRHIICALPARDIGDFLFLSLNGYAFDAARTGLRFLTWRETALSPLADR
jgi:hypothetical protein